MNCLFMYYFVSRWMFWAKAYLLHKHVFGGDMCMVLKVARHMFCGYQCRGIISASKIDNQLVRPIY